MFKKYRLNKNLTQETAAELLGISTRHLQRIEKEDNLPSLELLKKMIKLFDIKGEDIINFLKKED